MVTIVGSGMMDPMGEGHGDGEQGRAGRSPQQARSRDTRQRLLDAAIDCLVELGYAGTTTTAVLQRSGVARGSLLHQFPSRDALLLAAVDHLVTEGMRDIVVAIDTDGSPSSTRDAVEVLWGTFGMRYFWASVEVWLASRTDAGLRDRLAPSARQLGALVDVAFARLFEGRFEDPARLAAVQRLLLTSMRGVALTYAFRRGDQRTEPMIPVWCELVERFQAD